MLSHILQQIRLILLSPFLTSRCFLGEGSGPAQWPNVSRLVEAICRIYSAGQTIAKVRVNQWAAILRVYRMIRDIVLDSPGIMDRTKLKLFELKKAYILLVVDLAINCTYLSICTFHQSLPMYASCWIFCIEEAGEGHKNIPAW